ncbi:MAG TPA: sigma-70 family RNA polymerase sigma factor [Povalibacter sp.]
MADAVHVDWALSRKILAGDAAAFRSLFDSFFPRLYRFALARLGGDEDAASEVVQLTFCKAIERLDSYRGEAALYTWFCQVCRNAVIDYRRANSRKARTVVLLEDQPNVRAILEALTAPATDQPDLQAWQQDVRRLVQATVDTLPERYGVILEWKYVDGLSVEDIASRLEIGAKAAESLLTRARHSFRDAMTALGGTPDALHPPQHLYDHG